MMPKIAMGIETRSQVLQYSLIIENLLSIFLAEMLGIKDQTKSKVLGNTGGAISFNQKVQLLIEIRALDSSISAKYITFMEVRNQFMHNLSADSYEKCLSFINGKAKFLLNLYPAKKNGLSQEKQLEQAFLFLADELARTTVGLIENVKEQIRHKVEHESLKEFQQNAFSAITEIEKAFDGIYDKLEKKGKATVKAKELKDLGKTISKIFYRIIISKVKKREKP